MWNVPLPIVPQTAIPPVEQAAEDLLIDEQVH
jgi:hypothetical protein